MLRRLGRILFGFWGFLMLAVMVIGTLVEVHVPGLGGWVAGPAFMICALAALHETEEDD